MKGITLNICTLCFVLINSEPFMCLDLSSIKDGSNQLGAGVGSGGGGGGNVCLFDGISQVYPNLAFEALLCLVQQAIRLKLNSRSWCSHSHTFFY